MARKRVKAAAAQQTENIFDALARHGQSMNGPEPARTESAKTAQPELQALLDRMDKLDSQNQDLQRRLMMASASPITQRTSAEPALTARDVPLKFDDLLERDPISGVTYIKDAGALTTRISSFMDAREKAIKDDLADGARSAQSHEDTQRQLETAFYAKYPDWEDHPEIVNMVSARVAAEAKAKGVDVQRYIIGNSDIFLADVAAALQKQYGALVEDGENEAGADEPEHLTVGQTTRGRATSDSSLDDGRTAGIFGGQGSGGQPAQRKGAVVEPAGDEMEKDLQAVQMKMGLYSIVAGLLTMGIIYGCAAAIPGLA